MVTRSRYLPSQYIEKKHYTRFGDWRSYSWGHRKGDVKGVEVNGAQNKDQGHQVKVPAVCILRSTMQGLVVVGLVVEKILNINVKCVKGTGAQNIGQGYRVKIPAESVHQGEALCKVRSYTWGDLERWRKLCQSHSSQNIGQLHQVKVSAAVHWEEALCKVWWL